MPKTRNINTVAISGKVLSSPELRYTPRNVAVLDFRLVTRPYKRARAGLEWDDPPVGSAKRPPRLLVHGGAFFEVVAIGDLAETGAEYLDAGKFVTVTGRLAIERWEYWKWKGSRVKILAQKIEEADRARELPMPAVPDYVADVLKPALKLYRQRMKRMSAADATAFLNAAVNPFIRIYNRNRRRFAGPQAELWRAD
jgi:hypothetical protein